MKEDAYHSALVPAAGRFALRVRRSAPLRAVLIAIAACAAIVAWRYHGLSVPAIVVASLCMFVIASASGRAARIAGSLQHLQGRRVDVRIWGEPIRLGGVETLEAASITALSAGLLIYLRTGSTGGGTLLKIAQPEGAVVGESGTEISGAAYVSWGGVKLSRVADVPAVEIQLAK